MSRTSRWLVRLLGIAAGATLGTLLTRRARINAQPDYFAGKVVLITGASRGIGRVLAIRLAQQGAHLILAARDEGQLQEVAAACGDAQILLIPTDITNEDHLQALVARSVERFGQIDILINNAGVIQGGAVADVPPSLIRQHFEVNVLGTMRLTQLALPHMIEQGKGHIVLVGSTAGRNSMPYFTAYTASKHALVGFANSLRLELAGKAIKVTLINPSFTDTDMVAEAGRAWKRMGFVILPVDEVVTQMLNAIQLGLGEQNIGVFETFGGIVNSVLPSLSYLYWRIIAPRDLPQIAERQQTK